MSRVSLQEAMEFLKEIDVWHEFKFSDDQIMRVAPELQDFGREVLARAMVLIKTMEKKPSPAKIMQMCREQQILLEVRELWRQVQRKIHQLG